MKSLKKSMDGKPSGLGKIAMFVRNSRQMLKSIGLGAAIFAGLVIYAYGFQVTKVNLQETKSERRQTQLVRILRALAKPDLLTYQYKEFEVNAPIMVPCPPEGYTSPAVDTSQPYMLITPPCAAPGDMVVVEGFHFQPNQSGPLSFIPPSGVKLNLGTIQTDEDGRFRLEVKLPKREANEVNYIRGVTRQRVGMPQLSQTARDTWDKIVETVFLALLATTIGTLIAIPLSFFAAQNLMKDITSPLTSVALNILALPLGFYLGGKLAAWVAALMRPALQMPLVMLAGIGVGVAVMVGGIRWALPQQEESVKPSLFVLVLRGAAIAAALLAGIFSLFLLSSLAMVVGDKLAKALGAFGFLGLFIADLGEILNMALVALVSLAGAGVFAAYAGQLGNRIARQTTPLLAKPLSVLLSALAGAVLLVLTLQAIDWFYQIGDPRITLWAPAVIGGAAGLLLAFLCRPNQELPVGMVIYFIARTIFNALRSIESLVMVIVFAVWVGIGPFAGVLALSLHTIAALAKLYSEQVESILPGPVEAVKATGANRLQTIVYAVIPQIIPPYISFTMYRWDINVRMSTIIGFAGGGGIGFLLQQNINLLNYRAASAQMLAIAVVVASMDYLSAKMRERTI